MLPEHRRMYAEEAGARSAEEADAATSRLPTRQELEWVRDRVVLSVLLVMADRGRREIARSSVPLKRFFQAVAGRLAQRIEADLRQLRRALDAGGIRIVEETRSEIGFVCRFVCRGREERLALTRDALRAEIRVKLETYLSDPFQEKD